MPTREQRGHLGLSRKGGGGCAQAAVARGELVLGGALAEPADQAILLFKGTGPDAATAFAEADPYVREGLVRSWKVRLWTTVVGADALTMVT